jgi:hypothetical protein
MIQTAIELTDSTIGKAGDYKKHPQILAAVLNAIAVTQLSEEIHDLREDLNGAIKDELAEAVRGSKTV